MKVASLVAAALVCCQPAVALANWRDGCPATPVPGPSDPRRAVVAEQWGTSAEHDSALAPSRLAVLGRLAYFLSSRVEDDDDVLYFARARMATLVLHGALNGERPVIGAWRPGFSLTYAAASAQADATEASAQQGGAAGNVVASAWLRRSWLNGDWRSGLAVRAFFAPPSDDGDRRRLDEYAARQPMAPQLFSPYAFGAVIERRSEMRGCYGLFLDARAAVAVHPSLHYEDGTERGWYVSVLPSLTMGANVSDAVTAYLEAGLQVDAPHNPIGGTLLQRYRLGAEHSERGFSYGGYVDLMVGAYDGIFVGFSMIRPL